MILGATLFARDYGVTLNLNAGSQLSANLVTRQVSSTISGSGVLTLKGKVSNSKIAIRGSGQVKATQLESYNTEAVVNGSGDLSINAKLNITGEVRGSAVIAYRGTSSPLLNVKTIFGETI